MIHVEYESLFFSMKKNYINAVFYSFCTCNVKYVKGKIILLVFDGYRKFMYMHISESLVWAEWVHPTVR